MEKPPAKGDNDWGSASYLGHPGEQKLHWGYWRHRWSVEFNGKEGCFVALPDTLTAPAQPRGPGGVFGELLVDSEINPDWEKACQSDATDGHLMCQYERGDLLVGVIAQRAGRVKCGAPEAHSKPAHGNAVGTTSKKSPCKGTPNWSGSVARGGAGMGLPCRAQ